MNITTIVYSFSDNNLYIKSPVEIIKETDLCYCTKKHRYFKSKIGKPILKSATSYAYIELVMVDADENTLRTELSKWFDNKASEIRGK